MIKVPEYAKRTTNCMRWLKIFHQQLVYGLGTDSIEDMYAFAWQMEKYIKEQGEYHDTLFIRTLQQSLEKIIQYRTKKPFVTLINTPRAVKKKEPTQTMQALITYHKKLVRRLGTDRITRMRGFAWQMENYLEEHGEYHDSEFIRTLQQSLEKIIQSRSTSWYKHQWTVARAQNDSRGRARGINQFTKGKVTRSRVYVPAKLSQEINKKITSRPQEID